MNLNLGPSPPACTLRSPPNFGRCWWHCVGTTSQRSLASRMPSRLAASSTTGSPLWTGNNPDSDSTDGRPDDDGASRNHEDLPLPEGDFGLPVVGYSLKYFRDKHDFVINRVQKYGPVSKTSLFGKPCAIIAGPELLRKVYVEEEVLGQGGFPNFRELLGSNSMFFYDGEKHMFLRKLLAAPFTKKAISARTPQISKLAAEKCREWAQQGSISFEQASNCFAFSVITEAVLDLRFPIGGYSKEDILDAFQQFTAGVLSFSINLPFTKFGKAMAARKLLLEMIQKEIELIQNDPGLQGGLRALLSARDENGEGLKLEQLQDNILTILLSGYDTSASAASITLLKLAQHPQVWEKMRKEQDMVMAKYGRDITEKALDAMTYTDAVIKEAMRVLPVVSGGFRVAKKSFELNGYRIPSGWSVLTAIGTTAQYLDDRWPMDAEFNPDRFLTPEGREPRHNFCFGKGPHQCIGRYLSIAENKILFARLARDYDVQVKDVDPKINISPFPRPEGGFPVVIKQRSK